MMQKDSFVVDDDPSIFPVPSPRPNKNPAPSQQAFPLLKELQLAVDDRLKDPTIQWHDKGKQKRNYGQNNSTLALLLLAVCCVWYLYHNYQRRKHLKVIDPKLLREQRIQTLEQQRSKAADNKQQGDVRQPSRKNRALAVSAITSVEKKDALSKVDYDGDDLADEKQEAQDESLPLPDKEMSLDPSAAIKKPKRKRISYPPPQIVCEALSKVFQRPVKVEPRPQEGVWGGKGWVKRPVRDYPYAAALVVRFPPPASGSTNNTWEALCDSVFPQVLESLSREANLLAKDIRKAAVYHTRVVNTAREGSPFLLPGDDGVNELKLCLYALRQWLVQQVATWLPLELMDSGDACDDAYDDDNLFSAEYNTSFTAESQTGNKLDSLFQLLEEAEPVLTSDFLEDLFECCKEKGGKLPEFLLQKAMSRLADAQKEKSFSCSILTHRVMGVSNLLVISPSVRDALSQSMHAELGKMEGKNGKEIQTLVALLPIFEAAAFSVPPAGTDSPSGSNCFLHHLDAIENYPLCVFGIKRDDAIATGAAVTEARNTMKMARGVAEAALRAVFKTCDKETMFRWIGKVVNSNTELVNLLKSDLLSTGGIVAESSSRAFLLGFTSTLISFCGVSLGARFGKMGASAFDASYLASITQSFGHAPLEARNQLFQGAKLKRAPQTSSQVAGATQFFFLSCLCLRVALHPALRMEGEFLHRQSRLLNSLRGVASATAHLNSTPATYNLQSSKPIVAAWIGWKGFLEAPDVVAFLTDFALTQLGWLAAFAQSSDVDHSLIPDWMCREPARWLSHVANVSSSLLTPVQAEKAVEYATLLLELGAPSSETKGSRYSYSPIVLTSLIEIASNFVQAGVRRARSKQQRQSKVRAGAKRPTGFEERFEEAEDDRDLEVYLSFDKKDLGVTVFTNRIVREKLSPTLARTFCAVDVVEGYDADRDDGFSKFHAKTKIAELLLRLWPHPSGEYQKSLSALSRMELLSFTSSVASAVAVCWDFGSGELQKIETHSGDSPTQRAYRDEFTTRAVGMLVGLRKYLALFCTLSNDQGISRCIGGASGEMSDTETKQISGIANMIVQLLDSFTSADGGTNPSIEEPSSVPTAKLASSPMSEAQVARAAEDVVRRRIKSKTELGLDISILSHTLLALAAKWHLTAIKADDSNPRISTFLSCLAANEDCDLVRMQHVFRRLVKVPTSTQGSEAENAASIFLHDGYVDHTTWKHKYVNPNTSEAQKMNRKSSMQDQMKHGDIAKVASEAEIGLFLDHLGEAIAKKEAAMQNTRVDPSSVSSMELSILTEARNLDEDAYANSLKQWVVSSEPFMVPSDDTRFAHKNDAAARKQLNTSSGKTLVKEARKCQKHLPEPNANAAAFVCFAEERMDLCRFLVTGPVDTPYAHGLFVFDVFLPQSYPQIAPLVTFMTTGGGHVRFNPNLYTDGKVCISLLGSTNATDESQRWNPSLSSLAQVMISIQSQIFGVTDPYFNEGNGVPEMMRHTKSGREGTMKYNNTVRLATLRYAMVAQLRSPPCGFNDVTIRHFSLCRRRVVVQARRWMLEARGTGLYPRYERAYSELVSLLEEKCHGTPGSLPPLPEDVAALAKLEPSFVTSRVSDDNVKKPRATNTSTAPTEFNPWAVSAGVAARALLKTDDKNSADDTDDMYS